MTNKNGNGSDDPQRPNYKKSGPMGNRPTKIEGAGCPPTKKSGGK